MAQVIVSIDGKTFRMVCAEGEEAHLSRLAALLDAKIALMRRDFGEIGDLRLTVMAALTFIDEVAELQERLSASAAETEAVEARAVQLLHHQGAREKALAATLERMTQRIERITDMITGKG